MNPKLQIVFVGITLLVIGYIGWSLRGCSIPAPPDTAPIATAEGTVEASDSTERWADVWFDDTVIVDGDTLEEKWFNWEVDDDSIYVEGRCFGIKVDKVVVDSVWIRKSFDIKIFPDSIEATPRTNGVSFHFANVKTRDTTPKERLIGVEVFGGMPLTFSGWMGGLGLQLQRIPFSRKRADLAVGLWIAQMDRTIYPGVYFRIGL